MCVRNKKRAQHTQTHTHTYTHAHAVVGGLVLLEFGVGGCSFLSFLSIFLLALPF